jgi:superfamily I DNA/RNA helicase
MSYVHINDWCPQGVGSLEPAAMTGLRLTDQSVCVVASAGAGKTEFLAQKAAYLLDTGLCRPPFRILAISFKSDAAKTLAERVRMRCPSDLARRFDSMTFDAFTKNLIDRFGSAIPPPYRLGSSYRIVFPGRDLWEDFLRRHGAEGMFWSKLAKYVSETQLPIASSALPERWKQLVEAYWREALDIPVEPALAFPMINRLSEYLLRSNAQIRRALRQTYPFVFLDEFQDTTTAQYQLLRIAFLGSTAKLTVVGDDKQQIMGWAGAMKDGFARLVEDFDTAEIGLVSNWRSHADLVSVQHVIAQVIDEDAMAPEARATRNVDGEVVAVWSYDTQEDECAGMAAWIAKQVASGEVRAEDIALLVRMRADRVEEELSPAFEKLGLKLRNLARIVGQIAIQDLLSEELTAAVLPLLRLGAQLRAPDAWQSARALQEVLRGVTDEDEQANIQLRKDLEENVGSMRGMMRENEPCEAACDLVLECAFDFLNEAALRSTVPAYRRAVDYQRVKNGALLIESAAEGGDWSTTLNRFVGVGQVPLMTIHKSKGLEFHTMIFFGLDNQSWWSLKPDKDEELKSFFVAFTRAMQRAFFTSCQERGGTISWIEALIGPAGVLRINGPMP